MKKQFFGTDGIRGHVGQSPITPEFMLKLGWAVGQVFTKENARNKVLIGKDTRISGYLFESALESGLCAAGVDIRLLGPMPTPAIAYLTRTFHARAGIVISASHNPYHDNGIKFFSADGTKLPDELELAIEQQLQEPMVTVASKSLGKASRIIDAEGRYIEFCKSTVPAATNLQSLKIVLDCANGATYQVAPNVFKELGAEVITIGVEPNGININDECGSTAPKALQEKVLMENADLGIAFDGDGDRVIMVDHKGEVVDGDEIVFIIASNRIQDNRFHGGVVGTLMSNLGLELSLAELNIPFVRTNVGDRHIMAELIKQQWFIGGEASGHIMCRDVTTTGDGIVSSLQVVADMVSKGQSLHELKSKMQKMPQKVINVPIKERFDPYTKTNVKKAISDTENKLKGKGRVLLRPSGTEPVIRVMVEGEEIELVDTLAQELASVVEDVAA